MSYAIRITPREDSADEDMALQALTKIGGAHVGCREFATSMHIHIVLWTDRKVTQVRNAFNKALGKTGNGVISIKVAKDDKGAMRYACKGDASHPEPKGQPPEVVWHYGHTVYPTPLEAYEAYWSQSDECRNTKGLQFHTQVTNRMKQNQIEFTALNVAQTIMDMCIETKTSLNEYYMIGVGKMVMAINSRRYRHEQVQQLASKIDQTHGNSWQA